MRRISPILILMLSLPVILKSSAYAERPTHRPWFSKSENVSSPADERALESAKRASRSVRLSQTRTYSRSSSDTGTQVARRALQYKGSRYRFGGATKRGMDCSGLVARVWSDLKLKRIPRASSALYNSGKPVHLAELKPGDLVFFKNTYKHGISHVGVYAGKNKFVHAAGRHKGVIITKLSDPYYQLHYAGARRLY